MHDRIGGAGQGGGRPSRRPRPHLSRRPKGQYTNSIKPILPKNPVDGGTFHPNANGQRELAYLLSCYLKTYSAAPHPFVRGVRHTVSVTGLVDSLGALDLSPPPGSMQAPLRCS